MEVLEAIHDVVDHDTVLRTGRHLSESGGEDGDGGVVLDENGQSNGGKDFEEESSSSSELFLQTYKSGARGLLDEIREGVS